jgi:hypothetical protein
MKSSIKLLSLCGTLGLPLLALTAGAQIPRINTFFPIGAKSGSTVEVEVRGASLEGAQLLMVHGKGLSGTVSPGGAKVDEANKPIWQSKCGSCHELRSPANRSLTPGQWAATVERMVKVRSAPLSADETTKVTQYLVSAARAGRVTAQITVAPDTLPGIYEVRLTTPKGVSSPYWFEVGTLPEVMAANVSREQAQPVTLPCVVNGCLMNGGERHYFKFSAKKGDRSVFNLKAFRYAETNQFFFSPNLRLYDASGKQLVENHGYFDMDPLIDWTCPADGDYTIEVRDLLGRANPASVYRLTLGKLPYDSVISPAGGQAGTTIPASVAGKMVEGLTTNYSLPVPTDTGIVNAPSPFGPHLFYSSPYKVVRDDAQTGAGLASSALPAAFTGVIGKAGETDSFTVQGTGTFEFEGYATRVGSPVSLSVAIVKADGGAIGSFGGDGRMVAKLEAGQTYQLRIANGTGQAGPNMVYAVEARPAKPGLECVLRPDNITIRPGVSTAAMVILTRREGIEGDITVTAEDLPAGVTMTPAIMQPDRNIAWLMFNAAPDAAPIEKPVRVFASGHGPLGDVKALAVPQEEYRLNNDPRYRNWSDVTVAVRGQRDFTVEFVDKKGPIRVHPRKGTPVKVKITRRAGFTGNVTVFLSGLPLGWVANPEATTGNELTLTVRPDGNDTNPYLKRDPKWTPIVTTLEASSDEFRFAFGTMTMKRVDVITDKDD